MRNIYLITNTINNKQYVGKTKQDINERLKQHKWCNYNTKIHLAILEYGISNFNITLLQQVEDSKALQVEKYYTKYYNTIFPNGYNEMVGQSLSGGNNRMGGRHLPESWKKNCARIGINNGRANVYEIKYLDTNEIIRVNLRSGISEYLGISMATVKKWLNKEHIDCRTKRPIIFYSVGRIKDD